MAKKPSTKSVAQDTETPAHILARLRRSVAAKLAGDDVRFLVNVVNEQATLVARAVNYVETVAAGLAKNAAVPAILTERLIECARTIDLAGSHYGIWYRVEDELPTRLPSQSIEVLYYAGNSKMPIHGLYITDEKGVGVWEIYSGLQNYVLEYKDRPPLLWCYAPTIPGSEQPSRITATKDRPLDREDDRLAKALAGDLKALGFEIEADAIANLPSLKKMQHEINQVQTAHIRTAEALGVPADAHSPANRARELVKQHRPV